jgi:exodeoxyribonuclease V beta subunit
MQSFNVLDRHQNIHRNYLLEASAGTGKTFSIENIVVRLLIEGENPLNIDQILVVTFTKTATRDLKIRIRSNIENAINILSGKSDPVVDYLQACLELGYDSVISKKRRLEQALFNFDQANIFTIHGFCARMLQDNVFEGNLSLEKNISEESAEKINIDQIIRDFIRTELLPDSYSTSQLEIVLSHCNQSIDALEKNIKEIISKDIDIEPGKDFSEQLTHFKTIMSKLKLSYNFSSEKIIEDYAQQAFNYTELNNRDKTLKLDKLAKVEYLANLLEKNDWEKNDFEKLLKDGIFICEALDSKKLKKKFKPSEASLLHYPQLIDILSSELKPLIDEARNPFFIITRMAHGCLQMLRRHVLEEEQLSFDDLLKRMFQGLHNPQFLNLIRSKYKVAIVDEFQDTDPIQWGIFNKLFLSDNSDTYLYLVGDPKQSIYAFRQADIYTYLKAAEAIGSSQHASLDTNFRSQPSLVTALNTLFSTESAPGLIGLPLINKTLEYRPVKFSETSKEKKFSDNFGSVHFCITTEEAKSAYKLIENVEEKAFFPFFVKELSRLKDKDNIDFNKCAILVKDRYQAKRTAQFLTANGIPCVLQKAANLGESTALAALQEILHAVIHPKQASTVKKALGGILLNWPQNDIRNFSESEKQEEILSQFYSLRKVLHNDGFAQFFQNLLNSKWNSSQSIIERLLSIDTGIDLYDNLQQLAQLIIAEEHLKSTSAESLIAYLMELSKKDTTDDPRLKKISNSSHNSVNILTLHSSKGLEFDIVFALGLISPTKAPGLILPIDNDNNKRVIRCIADKESMAFQKHCQELDAEKMRQLYVAMTRAKYRIYLPTVIQTNKKTIEPGQASPMDLFLARLGQPRTDANGLKERLENENGKSLETFLDSLSKDIKISYSKLNQQLHDSIPMGSAIKVDVPKLIPPKHVDVPGENLYLYSFTTLSGKIKPNPIETEFSSFRPPHDFYCCSKNPHTLPSGSETGNLLHKILEDIPFDISKKQKNPVQLLDFITPYIYSTPFESWNDLICNMIYNALMAPLFTVGHHIRLCDIPQKSLYRETEFLYPKIGFDDIEELNEFQGYLKGVIDLLFYYEGKYYLLDWKSNWLGPSTEFYEKYRLEAAMKENHYYIQAAIYKGALKQFLKLVDPRPFDEIFGGVFYIFLRGLDLSNSRGILHFN